MKQVIVWKLETFKSDKVGGSTHMDLIKWVWTKMKAENVVQIQTEYKSNSKESHSWTKRTCHKKDPIHLPSQNRCVLATHIKTYTWGKSVASLKTEKRMSHFLFSPTDIVWDDGLLSMYLPMPRVNCELVRVVLLLLCFHHLRYIGIGVSFLSWLLSYEMQRQWSQDD